MALSRERMIDRMAARDPAYDGRFITGVLSTGIYCLPSCPARNPKPGNVRFFDGPEAARSAGLRPCKRCRPDDFYRRHDPDRELAEGLARRLRTDPGRFAGVGDLARAAGVGASKLHGLFRRHFHTTPARLLGDARVEAACRQLLADRRPVADVAFAVGFESLSSFNAAFRRRMALAPQAYRRLAGGRELELALPASYRLAPVLAHLGRDPESCTERVRGRRYAAALWLPGRFQERVPARLSVELAPGRARGEVHSPHPLGEAAAATAHRFLLRRLGLAARPGPFERRVARNPRLAPLVDGRRGLRMPLVPDSFDCLTWAILGQQVSLPFACTLRRRVVERAGEPAGDGLTAPPGPEAVAALAPEELTRLQLSRRKAEYLVSLAARVASGALPLEELARASAVRAEETLTGERGLGPWSAGYLMMRGLGFADAVPLGDAGLARALERFFHLEGRPDREETRELLRPFAPYRAYATFHLWQTLEEPEETTP